MTPTWRNVAGLLVDILLKFPAIVVVSELRRLRRRLGLR